MKRFLQAAALVIGFALLVFPTFAQEAEPITFGETVESSVDADQPMPAYAFEAQAGQVVSITLLAEGYDPLLVLLGPDGSEVAMNDDGAGNLNSRIGPFAIPAKGVYTIVATSYASYWNSASADISGTFTLTLEEVEIRQIEYTQVVKGETTPQQPSAYLQFRGEAGDVINITAETSDFSANLSLSLLSGDNPGPTLTNAVDTSGQGIALIGGYALPETGSYLITLTSSDGDTGEYTLVVERQPVLPLAFDEPVTLTFDTDEPVAYLSFDAESGDVISLTVEGDGEFDTTMSLNGPDGYQVAYSDDSSGLDPAIAKQILTASGSYSVMVRPYHAGETGEVTLTLERGVLLSLDDGPQTLEFSADQTRDTLTLSGGEGEVVRLTLAVSDSQLASPSVSVMQGDVTIAQSSGSTLLRMSLDFDVPRDGDVLVQIDEYSYTDITLVVEAERLEDNAEL